MVHLTCALLGTCAIVHADLISVSQNALYTADVHFGMNGGVSITGPDGTENFYDQGLFDLFGVEGVLVNDYGQVVGYTDGGTDDPGIYFALYTGAGDFTVNFGAGNGAGYIGTVPNGVDFGSLGWSMTCSPPGDCLAEADLYTLTLTDSGAVSAVIDNYVFGGGVSEIGPQQWLLPNETPEPASIILLLTVLSGLGLERVLSRRHRTTNPKQG